jgi:hypothetical protein
MLNAHLISRMQDDATERWHRCEALAPDADPLLLLARAQHRANYDLWHEEDNARCPDAPDQRIADVKHSIDRLNQKRNDLVEQMDHMLLEQAGPQNDAAPMHSETPGLIVDRLSILALKIYHTDEQAHRVSASPEHRAGNIERLHILEQQRADLAECLDELWREVISGRRRFRLYRQLKMYNDPELNPAIYEHKR